MTEDNRRGSRWAWLIGLGCALVVLLAVLAPSRMFTEREPSQSRETTPSKSEQTMASQSTVRTRPDPTAEEIVASKLDQFARDRLRITRAMARRGHAELPAEVDQFFNAVAANRWDELNDLYRKLEKIRDSGNSDVRGVWAPILETLLVAECVHSWPAQKLLDYGQATLGSLSPGMVYVGGTDPGRGIPTLLNETSGGERHVILTQNALADAGYLDYVRFLYGDQLQLPGEADSSQAFSGYLADAQQRFLHDQQFPNEPKQVRPGEDIQWTQASGADSSGAKSQIQVSGNVAVMSINERILQGILDKNPGMTFAMEESFPLLSTYASAIPLGPLMELRAPNAQDAFTLDTAGGTLDYWRNTLEQLQADADAPEGSEVRKSYSHMAVAQANLLANHNYTAEAEATYRAALELEPSNPEAVYGLSKLLGQNGRLDEAQLLVDDFARTHPDQAALPQSVFIFGTDDAPK